MVLEVQNTLRNLLSKEARLEKDAQPTLQEFLKNYYWVIRRSRVIAQCAEGILRLDASQHEELISAIQKDSPPGFDLYKTSLCEIGDAYVEFQHESSALGSPIPENPQFVRGFYFPVKQNDVYYECVDLDDGRSRVFFDVKNDQQKRKFMQRFAYRNAIQSELNPGDLQWALNKKGKPNACLAFISDNGNQFTIEHVVTRWPLNKKFFG